MAEEIAANPAELAKTPGFAAFFDALRQARNAYDDQRAANPNPVPTPRTEIDADAIKLLKAAEITTSQAFTALLALETGDTSIVQQAAALFAKVEEDNIEAAKHTKR